MPSAHTAGGISISELGDQFNFGRADVFDRATGRGYKGRRFGYKDMKRLWGSKVGSGSLRRFMMKRSALVLMLGFAFAAQPLLSVMDMTEVQAAVRKNVSEFAGQRCNSPARGSGIIVGRYSGTTDNPIISMGGDNVPVSDYRCFRSMEECRGWLYTMRSKYTDGNSVLIGCNRR